MSIQTQRIVDARRMIILDAPFFGSLLMRLNTVRDDTRKTFSTNGREIKYNEDYCASLSDPQLRGVLVHEVGHVAQGHLWRCGGRDMKRWNCAADLALNEMLEKYAEECRSSNQPVLWELPPGGLRDASFDGKSSEEMYTLLPDDSGGGGGYRQGSGPGEFEQPAETDASQPGSEEDWKIAVVQAATVAKMQGNCPGAVRRLVDALVNPRVPWAEVLREFIRQQAREDYTWRRPARRYLSQGIVLPSLYSERTGAIAVAVDTSCSITPEILRGFACEMQGILEAVQPEKLIVIYCDARVQLVSEYEPGDAIRLDEAKGGGGTDFRPVWDHLDGLDEPPAAAVYLTDLEGTHRQQEPDYPVLWATLGRQTAPWGQVVRL